MRRLSIDAILSELCLVLGLLGYGNWKAVRSCDDMQFEAPKR